jgi:hypothetical protein
MYNPKLENLGCDNWPSWSSPITSAIFVLILEFGDLDDTITLVCDANVKIKELGNKVTPMYKLMDSNKKIES